MRATSGALVELCRKFHTISSRDGPNQILKKKVAEINKKRIRKIPGKHDMFVEAPEGLAFLDTASMPMILTVVGTALFAKLLMMYDDSKSQERIERRIKNAPPGQGTVRMLSEEEWDIIKEIRPRTPFESRFSRSSARIRTGEELHWEDVKGWTIDVVTDGFTRAEECVKRRGQ